MSTQQQPDSSDADFPVADALSEKRQQQRDILEVRISGRTIWQVIGAILITLFLLWAGNQASSVLGMVAISFFFSLALDPAVRWLTGRYGWRRGSAVGLIYLGGFLFAAFMIIILIPSIVQLAQAIGENGADWFSEAQDYASENLGIEVGDAETPADLATGLDEGIEGFGDEALGTVVGFAQAGIGLIFSLATIAMFTFYFTAAAPQVQRAVLRLFSPATQLRVGWTWDQAIVQTGGYFYSRLILMVINGLGFFFTMVLVGMPTMLSVSLALFGSFVSVFIPAIGTYIGGAIPILVTLAIQGFTAALIVLGYVLLYQQVENYWLSPKISSETMTLNGGVAFGAALAGGAIAGPMGAFTALPIAALISSFISNYVASHEVVYKSTVNQDGDDESPSEEPATEESSKGKRT